jgi:hypothetical protein
MSKKPQKRAGGSANAAHAKPANRPTITAKSGEINETFGPPVLCCWRYGPGVCRFQTTSPYFARKLSRRSGAGLVAWSVTGGYLRIFQQAIEPWRARSLVTRYIMAANGVFSSRMSRQGTQKNSGR